MVWLKAILMLLYRSGLRVAEVLALRPADINLTAHTVRVLHGKGDKATTHGFQPSATDALARRMDTRRGAGICGPPCSAQLPDHEDSASAAAA